MSVSWTSGGYSNAQMLSDSYYTDYNGYGNSSWTYGARESDRNEIDVDESWQQFNDLYSNGTSSSYDSSNSSSMYSSGAYESDDRYGNSESEWTSSENEASLSSNSSLSSSSFSSETSSCSSCSESYQNSALSSDYGLERGKRRRNNLEPNEPVEPVGVWRYHDGQLVTLEENADLDGYFMNLTYAEEEMMRNKMCEAEGGFWCNQTVG